MMRMLFWLFIAYLLAGFGVDLMVVDFLKTALGLTQATVSWYYVFVIVLVLISEVH